jgi:hypothetical protein
MAVPAHFPTVVHAPCVQSFMTPDDASVRPRTTRHGQLVFSGLGAWDAIF